ncbi:MAG: hypothetical protein HJJLKODD_00217 [Phycisphaerae bacterium]|nr:hypothetical protein [Phycisphaerae bacterium]
MSRVPTKIAQLLAGRITCPVESPWSWLAIPAENLQPPHPAKASLSWGRIAGPESSDTEDSLSRTPAQRITPDEKVSAANRQSARQAVADQAFAAQAMQISPEQMLAISCSRRWAE